MCIIAVCRDRKLSEEELLACWENNSDGAGMAWFDNKYHVIEKGYMNIDLFKERYSEIDILPHVVHFRIATAGGVIPQLTHPFICSKMSPLEIEWKGKEPVLFHNGIISNWQDLAKIIGVETPNHWWSDTRVMASIVSRVDLDFLTEEGGKYVILVNKEIKIYGKFIEHLGIEFSNSGYEESWFNYKTFNYGSWYNTKYKKNNTAISTSPRTSFSICEACPDGNSNICKFCSESENSPWLVNMDIDPCDNCKFIRDSNHCLDCESKQKGTPTLVGSAYGISCTTCAYAPCSNAKYVCKACQNNPYKNKIQRKAITYTPTGTILCDNCNQKYSPVSDLCATCPSRPEKQVDNLCAICDYSPTKSLCSNCSNPRKPENRQYNKNKNIIYCSPSNSICDTCIHINDSDNCINCPACTTKSTEEELRESEAFEECDGYCDICPEYDKERNTCKEVFKAMTSKESLINLMEDECETCTSRQCLGAVDPCLSYLLNAGGKCSLHD